MNRFALRHQLGGTFIVIGVITVSSIIALTITFGSLLSNRTEVVNRLSPAAIASRSLLADLVNEETGVRGFALTGQESFLDPYRQGRADEAADEQRLHDLIGGDRSLAPHRQAVVDAAQRWNAGSATPLIDTVRRGGTPPDADLERSRQQFDEVRARVADLDAAIAAARSQATSRLDDVTRTLVVITVVAGLLLIAAAIALWVALQRQVLGPLEALGNDTRRVTAGDFRHELPSLGPPEIRALGDDIDAMRRRIVADLEAVEEARAAIEAQAEELTRSNTDLEQFAYVASHDLQEPLRKVTSFCQLLSDRYGDQLDERAQQYIDFAVDGAKRMQRLINDLLAFSRVGRTTGDFVVVDCGDAARDAVGNLSDAIERSRATVDVGVLPTVAGDPTLLTVLFQNLISNAIKFRSENPPHIVIRSRLDGGDHEVSVSDNGIGIEPRFADRIFIIFQRLHGRDEYDGTGIGLALCRRIVDFHGGRIWLDTDVETGTTIRFTLPLPDENAREGTEAA